MIDRAVAEAVVRDVIAACDPARRVADALAAMPPAAGPRYAVAIGKAALAMARGAGPCAQGVAVVPVGRAAGAQLPAGWTVMEGAHPVPDARSVAAGRAVQALVAARQPGDDVLVLISGGASAMVEVPRLPLAELVAIIQRVMAAGATIYELNAVRGELSDLKAGKLARTAARLTTLAVSDVIGDDLRVIGSGPTVPPSWGEPDDGTDWAARRRQRARAVFARYQLALPALLAGEPEPAAAAPAARPGDLLRVIAPMVSAAEAAIAALAARGLPAQLIAAPIDGDVAVVADQLAATTGAIVAWGEPTLRVPDAHGDGGRAQQLALELARRLRGGTRGALVVGTDGVDGPPPASGRPSPAGAWVDPATWDQLAAAGVDPAAALARCDAGGALAAHAALVVTGPSGINHADLVILG